MCARLFLGSLLAVLCSTPAFAQLSRVTGSILALEPGGIMRGTDTAYDPARDVFLVVVGNGPVYGVFVNSLGQPVTAGFTIMGDGASWAHFPRVEYSPHVGNGGFLVTWHHNVGNANYVFGRLVSFDAPGRLASGVQQMSDGQQGGTWWETGAAMAYSPTSHRFLVAWRTVQYGIQGRFVDTNGAPSGGVMQLENPGGSRDPALAWNAATDEFGLVSTGWSSSGALASFRRIRASDGSLSPRTTFGFSAGTFATAIDVNAANQYVLAWSLHPGTMSAAFDYNGNQLAQSFVTGRLGHDQSLALAYNRNSGTFLAVGSDSSSLEIAGVEMNSGGQPTTAAQIVTDGAKAGSNYPMTTARTGTNQWHVVYTRDFRGPGSQAIATSSTGGGTPWTPTSPTPPTPPTGGCATADPFASIGGGTCVNGGWVPGGSGGGSGGGGSAGGCATSSPGAGWTCVNGGWIPPTSGGGSGSTGGCTTADPFASIGGGTCANGGWVPGRSGGGGSTGGCSSAAPGPGWACVNGGWLPPTSGGGSGSAGGCSSAAPGPGWTCVNGGWLPPTSGGGSASSGGCTTPDPFASIGGGTCTNGGWMPGGPGNGGGSSSCSTAKPGPAWVCVNGGWLPGGSSPAPSSTLASACTSPDPFASMGGGDCVGGGWTPRNFTCNTPDPFVSLGGGVCTNGGWRPR